MKLNIVGILAPALSPDDDALFVDLRTRWIIKGLGHGHEDLSAAADPTVILERDSTTVTANAALRTYTAITPDNLSEFHCHGDMADFAITSAIVVPDDKRASAILLGRYLRDEILCQLVRPGLVIEELIETIFRIKRVLDIVVLTVALVTLLAVVLVFLLSLRLRERELATIFAWAAAAQRSAASSPARSF